MAENNHQRTLALRAPRGMVFDRNGELLVRNRSSYSISIVREHTKDLNRTVRLVASVLGIEEARVREIVDRHRREPVFRPVTIIEDASAAQVAAVLARRYELPDVLVEPVPTREYPAAPILASHVFGYVGEVTEAQVAASEDLKSGDIVGQSGIERIYNALLMGEDGAKRVVVNSIGREIRETEKIEATEGKRLQLTIDADVQRSIENGFRAFGVNGAAVLLDPANGDVLAYTSLPAYDPNAFAAGGDRRNAVWSSVNKDPLKPLTDRALQGRYPPGSTFKMAVAAAALEEGVITPDFQVTCRGAGVFNGNVHKCWKAGGHGTLDLRRAIEGSCNVYFYTIGNMAGVDRIHKWATAFGLGVKSGIDLPNEITGIVPSTEWKRRTTGEKWYAGETTSVAIGQGQVTVTPMSMAVYMAALANGGTRVTPHLLKAVDEGSGWKPVPAPAPQSQATMKPANLQAIRDGLWMVVNHAGTGGKARIAGARRLRQDRDRTGDFARGRPPWRRQDRPRSAGPRLVRVLRAARQPADCRRDLRRARRARGDHRADRQARDRDVLRQAGRQAAAGAAEAAGAAAAAESAGRAAARRHDDCRERGRTTTSCSRYARARRRERVRRAGGRTTTSCSRYARARRRERVWRGGGAPRTIEQCLNDACISTSTGRCWPPSSRCAGSASR